MDEEERRRIVRATYADMPEDMRDQLMELARKAAAEIGS
jgi:hypothetical protein